MTLLGPPAPVSVPCGDEVKWANPLDTTELARHVAECKDPSLTGRAKGEKLESLVCWLFSHIPGITAERRDIYSQDGSQELDVVFFNDKRDTGFPAFGSIFLVECKNWKRPVDSPAVAWMDWKLQLGGVAEGILLAANGVTHRSERLSDAVSIVTKANSSWPSRKIHMITLDEVSALTSTEDLKRLLRNKMMDLAAGRPLP